MLDTISNNNKQQPIYNGLLEWLKENISNHPKFTSKYFDENMERKACKIVRDMDIEMVENALYFTTILWLMNEDK